MCRSGGANPPKKPRCDSLRKFYGLTQTCRQTREEYRPIWLSKSKPRVEPWQLCGFLSATFRNTQDFQNAPIKFQLSWLVGEHDESGEIFNITPLLKMRAYRAGFWFAIIPHKLAENMFPEVDLDMCAYCLHLEEIYVPGTNPIEWNADDCTCDGVEEVNGKEQEFDCYEEIEHARVLEELINHGNEAWLEDVREDKITVTCYLDGDGDSYEWDVEIQINKPLEDVPTGSRLAMEKEYLSARGLNHGWDGLKFTAVW